MFTAKPNTRARGTNSSTQYVQMLVVPWWGVQTAEQIDSIIVTTDQEKNSSRPVQGRSFKLHNTLRQAKTWFFSSFHVNFSCQETGLCNTHTVSSFKMKGFVALNPGWQNQEQNRDKVTVQEFGLPCLVAPGWCPRTAEQRPGRYIVDNHRLAQREPLLEGQFPKNIQQKLFQLLFLKKNWKTFVPMVRLGIFEVFFKIF